MKQLLLVLMIILLMGSSDGQYPDCVSCPDGSVPLSPLSYNTMRSNVFNDGTQPSNEGCTNGVPIDGQVTIDCVQGTTLIDCDRGLNDDDYSDLSNMFIWNRTTSLAQVSVVFRFDRQVNISRIFMFFWNSANNRIIIPDVMLYWSNNDSIILSNEISFTSNSPSRTGDGRRRLNININNEELKFQYLRIVLSFYDDSDWIFLGEVQLCGNMSPYQIIQPPANDYVQIVSPTAAMANVTCSLNVAIPPNVSVTWLHNDSVVMSTSVIQTGNTTAVLIEDLQQSDAGLYRCSFTDPGGFVLQRDTLLLITTPQIIHPRTDFELVTFTRSTSSVELMCSLNTAIPSDVTIIWTHNSNLAMTTSPNAVMQTGNTATLIIGNPEPLDAGVYDCTFDGLRLSRFFTLVIDCGDPGMVTNGTITSNGTIYTSIATITCNGGYMLTGDHQRICQFNGIWSGSVPLCNVVVCGDPGVIINGTITSNGIIYTSVANFTCNDGYMLIGDHQRICQSNGTWSGSVPMCDASATTTSVTAMSTTELNSTSTSSVSSTTSTNSIIVSTATATFIFTSSPMSTTQTPTTSVFESSNSSIGDTSGGDSGGGSNVGAIVAPIVVIVLLVVVIIALVIGFLVWKRRQQKYTIANDENYYNSVADTKLKSLTIESSTLSNHFETPLLHDSTRSTAPVYSVPRRDSKKEPKPVEKTVSTVSQSSVPLVPDRSSGYVETMENTFYDEQPPGITETDADSLDDEILDDSFDEEDGPTPLHGAKKGVSPRRGKSKSPSKTAAKKSKQPSSSSTQSSMLSPLKSIGSHGSGADTISVEGDKTLKSLQGAMLPNPLYASTQSLSRADENIELNIYDSIGSPRHDDVRFMESIYSEIAEPNTLITSEVPKIDSVKDAKDLYPYSSIYAEPLPLGKSESPPLVAPGNLSEVKQLGTGQFGEVVLANTVGLSRFYLQLGRSEDCTVSIKVAIKKLKLNSTKEMQQAFEKEIKFMSRLKDDNVIRLLGICTSGTPFIMMEYMENGDLNQYLQQFELLLDPNEAPSEKQITPVTLIYMAYQIASGMKYLSSLKYVHRDLATRNVLVGKDYVVKIADFGMSQNLYSAYYFKVKGRAILPIRWMAYECFFGKFSVKTDVWAFGITLWEIFTVAKQQPYHAMGDQEVIDSALTGKKRMLMTKPDNCPDEIYEVMLNCWAHDPNKRATFTDLYETLKEINNRQF